MILRYPEYYEKFSCIAGRCEDTCCAGWEIDIDDASYEYYMQVPGKFGERLRSSIKVMSVPTRPEIFWNTGMRGRFPSARAVRRRGG